jgi:hypothetical protein
MLNRNLDEPQPLPERQIRCTGMGTQALCCSAYYNDDRSTWAALFQDSTASLLGDAADALCQKKVTVE